MSSTTAVGSYAAPQRRADYVAAMRAREYGRRPGPMLVYVSATPGRRAGGDWQQTLEWGCAALPAGGGGGTLPPPLSRRRYPQPAPMAGLPPAPGRALVAGG